MNLRESCPCGEEFELSFVKAGHDEFGTALDLLDVWRHNHEPHARAVGGHRHAFTFRSVCDECSLIADTFGGDTHPGLVAPPRQPDLDENIADDPGDVLVGELEQPLGGDPYRDRAGRP